MPRMSPTMDKRSNSNSASASRRIEGKSPPDSDEPEKLRLEILRKVCANTGSGDFSTRPQERYLSPACGVCGSTFPDTSNI